jgi:ABC-type lipoprotein release transport system permease subunit
VAHVRLAPLLFFAVRSLLAHPAISLLMVVALAAGVGFQIPNEANLTGYRAALQREVLEVGPGAVRVARTDGNPLTDARALAAAIRRVPEVRAAVPQLTMPGSVSAGVRVRACVVTGVDTRGPAVPFRLVAGELLSERDDRGVLLGKKYADELGVRVGDEVRLRVMLPQAPVLDTEDVQLRHTMIVRGVVSGGFGARNTVFVDLAFFEDDAGMHDEATAIGIYTADPDAAERVAQQVAAAHPELDATPWKQESQYARSALDAVDALGRVSIAMVLVAVIVPVLALFYINVLHRRREVGILAAIGLGRGEIFLAFLFQALLVACAAVPVGCLMGWGLVAHFQAHPLFEWEGFVLLPVAPVSSFLRTGALVFGVTLLAGAVPAWLAARFAPARVIRGIE